MPVYALGDNVPEIADRHWIAPDANIIGKVRVATDVGVWFCAVLRGDNEWINIGERTNIQEHAMLHSDMGFPLTIGEDCTIGHRAILHGCVIGNGSLIGMGATILNGAKIGSGSIVGANALVTEGKKFADGSLIVGSPAKAIRFLTEENQVKLKLSAAAYVKNWQRFSKDLKRIL